MHQRRIIRSIEIEMIIEIIVGNTVLGIMTNSSSKSGINIRHANILKVEVVDFMNNEGIHRKRDHVDKGAGVAVVVAVASWAIVSSQTKRVHYSLLREYARTKVVVIVVSVEEEKEGITICTVWTIIIMFFLRVTIMEFGAIIHRHNVIIA